MGGDLESLGPAPAVEDMSRSVVPDAYTGLSAPEHVLVCAVKTACLPFFPCYLRQVNDYERAVVLRLGKLTSTTAGAGGLYIVWPSIDELITVDVRERTVNVTRQAIVTSEGLTVSVDGVVFYKVTDAMKTVFGVTNYQLAVATLAQTKLREVLGKRQFEDIQLGRKEIEREISEAVQGPTDAWGITVMRVELTDVTLPANIQRAMGQEAESARNAKAKVIEAKGEEKASETLKEAADIMTGNPAAMQLRFLQTIGEIATEQGSTIVLPFPTDFLNNDTKHGRGLQVIQDVK